MLALGSQQYHPAQRHYPTMFNAMVHLRSRWLENNVGTFSTKDDSLYDHQ